MEVEYPTQIVGEVMAPRLNLATYPRGNGVLWMAEPLKMESWINLSTS